MNNLKKSATAARKAGDLRYFTGEPCKNGHVSTRLTSNHACDECMSTFRASNAEALKERDRTRNIDPKQRRIKRKREEEWRLALRTHTPWRLCLRNCRGRAAKSGISFTLTDDWGRRNWTGQCAITGIGFDLFHGTSHAHPKSPSVDRIDQSVGYIEGNCRFILQCVNMFRSTLGDREMLLIAEKIAASGIVAETLQRSGCAITKAA